MGSVLAEAKLRRLGPRKDAEERRPWQFRFSHYRGELVKYLRQLRDLLAQVEERRGSVDDPDWRSRVQKPLEQLEQTTGYIRDMLVNTPGEFRHLELLHQELAVHARTFCIEWRKALA